MPHEPDNSLKPDQKKGPEPSLTAVEAEPASDTLAVDVGASTQTWRRRLAAPTRAAVFRRR